MKYIECVEEVLSFEMEDGTICYFKPIMKFVSQNLDGIFIVCIKMYSNKIDNSINQNKLSFFELSLKKDQPELLFINDPHILRPAIREYINILENDLNGIEIVKIPINFMMTPIDQILKMISDSEETDNANDPDEEIWKMVWILRSAVTETADSFHTGLTFMML